VFGTSSDNDKEVLMNSDVCHPVLEPLKPKTVRPEGCLGASAYPLPQQEGVGQRRDACRY
jgi:hypothetical protein